MSTGSSDLERIPGLDQLLGLSADRGLGAVELVSNHTLSPFSRAGWQAADNLLAKAKRRFASGDDNAATALVDRAVALPYDTHEDAAPAVLAAHMILFCAVTDELERSSESDPRWLEAARAVLETADERARCDLRDVLREIRQDYELSKQEKHAVDAAVAGVPARAELRDRGPLPPEDLSPHIVAILRATVAYEAAVAEGESVEGST